MRNCSGCGVGEHPAAPFVDGLCDGCRLQSHGAGPASQFLGRLDGVEGGAGFVLLGAGGELGAAAAIAAGLVCCSSSGLLLVGLVLVGSGVVAAATAAVLLGVGCIRWAVGPYVRILAQQNDHLAGLLKLRRAGAAESRGGGSGRGGDEIGGDGQHGQRPAGDAVIGGGVPFMPALPLRRLK